MRRRHLPGAAAALGAGLAGCGGRPPTAGPPDGPTLTAADLRVRDRDCGGQVDRARVGFAPDGDPPTVTVEGTVWGADTCHTAVLEDVAYDAAADRLTVHVVSVREPTTGTPVCGQCIAEVDYVVRCRLAGGLPAAVRVVHGTGGRRTAVATVVR